MGEDLPIPIDVVFSKLSDWLVDRKRIPSDWRKRLLTVRSKITSAFANLPKDLNPWFATLILEEVGYLEAKQILSILTAAKPEARSLFGRLSGVAGDWDTIVRAYEKDLLFLGEATQTMVQNVNYEIPYLKKQTTKLHQQLGDLERKETEYKRNAAVAAAKYQQACQELGVKGTNIRVELLETTKNLHGVFAEVEKVLCDEIMGQAVDCYQAFVSYASSSNIEKSDLVVSSLMKYRDKHSDSLHSGNLINDEDPVNLSLPTSNLEQNFGESIDVLASDVSLSKVQENATNVDIDWDIGVVENSSQPLQDKLCEEQSTRVHTEQNGRSKDESVESLRGIDWNTKDIGETVESEIQWDIGNTDNMFTGESVESEIHWDTGNNDNVLSGESCIDWDISIEDSTGLDIDIQPLSSESHSPVVPERVVIVNELMETEFRNNLLDDLLELQTFLVLRIEEMNREETSSLQNQVQAICPGSLQQYGIDSFNAMCSEISKAIGLLTNKRNRDLIMMATSERFLNRLEASLTQKKQQESKLLENVREIHQKQSELRNTLAAIWPKQEAAVRRTRELKENCEKIVSTLYGGRKINIIGEINSVLGQA